MTRNVTPTHCHFIKIPDQFFVLNRFGGRSVFCQMYRLKLINRQIWESLGMYGLTYFITPKGFVSQFRTELSTKMPQTFDKKEIDTTIHFCYMRGPLQLEI